MAFWNKSQLNSNEYEEITKKIIQLSGKYEDLLHKVNVIVTDIANLRGRFNQKLSKIKKEDLETDEEQSINNGMLIPEYEPFFKNR